jgi:hypothetical protein
MTGTRRRDDHQSVRLDYSYPDARLDLNRWRPLVKWLLAIPHYIALAFLEIAAVVVVIVAWFAILFTGRYPQWHVRLLPGEKASRVARRPAPKYPDQHQFLIPLLHRTRRWQMLYY